MSRRVGIVGGGLAGSLLAILLARRGLECVVVERNGPFDAAAPAGRSINLALAARGIAALEHADVMAELEPLLLPMPGRIVHDADTERFLPYGQRSAEQIYSVQRHALNCRLYELARERFGVEYRFGHECVAVDAARAAPLVAGPRGRYELDTDVVIAADGAGSAVRRALAEAGVVRADEALLDHGYKELTIPAAASGAFALDPKGLHIWPRGEFMLIALPNPDSTFTATLFLPLAGPTSFATIGPAEARTLFERQFPDALALIPDVAAEYAARPVGRLGTVTCRPWSHAGRILLLGDAAHAIVPFHGQGMNAAFEDCLEIDRLTAAHAGDWPTVLAQFEHNRVDDARAIAAMALENYREMRADVRDPRFELRAAASFELERRFPGRFIPRYAMVMFHPEIAYAEAERRGRAQAAILDALTAGARTLDDVDFERAPALLTTHSLL
jgi:kynurenine 3-monooxygenase